MKELDLLELVKTASKNNDPRVKKKGQLVHSTAVARQQ